MILSRGKTDSAKSQKLQSGGSNLQRTLIPSLEDFILQRDYTGARTFLEFSNEEGNVQTKDKVDEWIAYCCFHVGDYMTALNIYESLIQSKELPSGEASGVYHMNAAVCLFYLGMYENAKSHLEHVQDVTIRFRFHMAYKLGNESEVQQLTNTMEHQMIDSIEDQLSLAAMYYLRAHYQEAIDIYKRILLDHREYLAINVYLAFCFYKLDYYDMSQEVLEIYLAKHQDSTIANNLKACNRFRLFNGHTAEQDIRKLLDSTTFGADLIRHNLAVFRNGDGALQTFPKLLDIIPEARLNLAIYYLKNGDIQEAYELIKDFQPQVPHEYILKGVVHATLGQNLGTKEHLQIAQQNFHLVGSSATECDTIPGRQSMASAFFLYGQFEEVLVYMNSIRSYFINDDTFIYNYAQAKCATGYYREAEELLMQITSVEIKNQHSYCMTLAKCHIHSGRPELAWNIFITRDTNSEAFNLLQLIANECYSCEEFWISAKAFDMLEKLDPSPENWEGKRGACAGVIYNIVTAANKARPHNGISEVIALLRESTNPQADIIMKLIRKHISSFK